MSFEELHKELAKAILAKDQDAVSKVLQQIMVKSVNEYS